MAKQCLTIFGRTLAVGLAGCSTMALAQGEATAQVAPDTSGQVQEIIVTAQKRSENLQKVPIAITAVTADAVKAAGITTTTDLGTLTPGLQIGQTGVIPYLFLRGIGLGLGTAGDEGGVSVVVDGVPITILAGSAFALNNIERIEVLRGPQGTLFGRNANGGVVNIVTKDPRSEPSADISVGYGNYNTFTGSVYATTGLAKDVAIDLAVQYNNQQDGYGHNLFDGSQVNRQEDISVRSKLKINATPTTTIRLAGEYYKVSGDLGVPRKVIEGAVGTVGDTAPANFYDVNENFTPRESSRTYGGSLRIEQILPWAQITSITAYRNSQSAYTYDQDSGPAPVVNAVFNYDEYQFSEELQLGSLPQSHIKWLVGGYYLKAKSAAVPIALSGLAFGGATVNLFSDETTRSLAGFAQATVPLGDTTNITGGVRYTSDRRGLFFFAPVGTTTFNKVTYRLAVDQKVSEDILVYASYNRGFKSGLYNLINPANPPILPEVVDAFEGGVKTELFDRHLRLNVAGFYYDYKNIQVTQIITGSSLILNAAKARVYGIDVDFEAHPVSNFTLSGGVELLNARYTSYPNAPGTVPNPTPTVANGPCLAQTPGPRTGGNTNCTLDASGNQLVRAPDMQFTLTAGYVIPSDIGKFGISGTLTHSASVAFEAGNRLRQGPTNLVNGQLTWDAPGGTYGARIWAKNLTEEKYYVQQSSSLNDTGNVGAPRTFGVTLEAHF